MSYVQSLSVLALMQTRPGLGGAERSLLAMGAPHFGTPATGNADQQIASRLVRGAVGESVSRSYEDRGLRWSALPGAEREIEAVAALFPAENRVVAVRGAASEESLRALNASGQLASFRYLLFATHAYLDTVVPARSALVLSQVDLAPGTDGYLTVAKWPAYRLQSELAVLSACETGLGRHVHGEGVMGLPYALFVAGNRATVLTLWRIEDAATATFVTELFRRIRKGADASDRACRRPSVRSSPGRPASDRRRYGRRSSSMGARRPVGQRLRCGLLIAAAALLVATEANAQTFAVQGACRDGVPHGAWQLTDANGRLRVLGAFNRGKRTGSFIYWNASGVRIAHMPYEEDARNGTLALWYQTPTKGLDAQQRLEAVYASGQLNGLVRIWNPDGRVRGEYRYAGGQLAGAKAWDARGRELPEAQARAQAESDVAAHEAYQVDAGSAGRATSARPAVRPRRRSRAERPGRTWCDRVHCGAHKTGL